MGESEAKLRIVVIDDDEQHLRFVANALTDEAIDVSVASNAARGLALVRDIRPHLVITDLMMPDVTGMELLEKIVSFDPAIEVVLLTGHYSTDSAVEAIQKGASDYLTKPADVERLQSRVNTLLSDLRSRQRCLELEKELVEKSEFSGMIGRSPLMLEVFHRIRRIAPHYRTVLVTGETGTGKELVARALQQLSPVSSGPLITCNCSALVETLVESELFGHVKGAFTGAVQDRAGVFEAANGGTVFLDEVGELSLPAQAKLLRVLQNQEIQRVGSPAVRKVDVRIIAATHRDLGAMVGEQRFREDLFYRLSMVSIRLPSLAQRKDDLRLLERYFLEKFAGQYRKRVATLTRRAQEVLTRYSWPGNVRELENVLGGACMMIEGESIDVGDIPESIRTKPMRDDEVDEERELRTLEEMEKAYTFRVLDRVKGNKVRAAEILGISRAKLYRILADSELLNEELANLEDSGHGGRPA